MCVQAGGGGRRRLSGVDAARMAALYRGVCADLALADAYQIPPTTVDYLHQLVAKAHHQLYRSDRFQVRRWARSLFLDVPGRLFRDGCLRLSFVLFWGTFLLAAFLSSSGTPYPQFAEQTVGREQLSQMADMFRESPDDRQFGDAAVMSGFYQFHNTTIGLRVFAWGLLLGVGGIYELAFNGLVIGAAMGHMTTIPERDNFYVFVTAHGPFELTAVILSAAAGMRLGFSLVFTRGLARWDSVQSAARQAMPAMGAAMVLFLLAAFVEAFISPSALPYEVKAAVSALSSLMLMLYFVMLGSLEYGATQDTM